MASADINTFFTFKGTKEELKAMLDVVKYYSVDCKEQYRHHQPEDGNCSYLDCVSVSYVNSNSTKASQDIDEWSENQIETILDESNGTISGRANGPYGVFDFISGIGIPEKLAEAAPGAYFKVTIEKDGSYEEETLKATLKDGIIYFEDYYKEYCECDEDDPYDQLYKLDYFDDFVVKKLPYLTFCDMAKITARKWFNELKYWQFICAANDKFGTEAFSYDKFKRLCKHSKLTEEEFPAFAKILGDLKISETNFYDYIDEKVDELDSAPVDEEKNREKYTSRWKYDIKNHQRMKWKK